MLGREGLDVAQEEVVEEAIVSTIDKGDACYVGGVWEVIGRGALQHVLGGKHARKDIMHEGRALGAIHQRDVGEEEVVIHRAGTVGDLNVKIAGIIVIEILGYTRALCLPIQPCSMIAAMMNVIVTDEQVIFVTTK